MRTGETTDQLGLAGKTSIQRLYTTTVESVGREHALAAKTGSQQHLPAVAHRKDGSNRCQGSEIFSLVWLGRTYTP